MNAGVMMDARVGPDDTDQLRCANGGLCPMAYLSASRIPSSLMDTQLNHCNLQSAQGGSAFGSFFELLGDMSSELLIQSSIEDGVLVIVNHQFIHILIETAGCTFMPDDFSTSTEVVHLTS